MCGIAGVLLKSGDADPEMLDRMMRALAHRGPDGSGKFVKGGRGLAHTRLAIIDLETGDPVYAAFDGIVRVVGWDGNGYGRYVLVRHYNGLETLYGHMSKQTVETGQLIKAINSDHFLLTSNVWDYLRGGRSSSSDLSFKPRIKRTVLHRVRSGETLSSVASRYGMSVSALKRKNHLSGSRLRPGQKLRVN